MSIPVFRLLPGETVEYVSPPIKLRRVCAWCSKKSGGRFESVIEDGSPGAKATHGICPFCKAAMDEEIAAHSQFFDDAISSGDPDGAVAMRHAADESPAAVRELVNRTYEDWCNRQGQLARS